MVQQALDGFFEKYIEKKSLFLNKKALQSFYSPQTILHREPQITQIASILAPSLKLEKPSNIFIYGKTGTGKTLTIRYVINELMRVASEQNIPLHLIYINCKLKKVSDTEYRLIAQLVKEFGEAIPSTGIPTQEVYQIFFRIIDNKTQLVILILDEIDCLVEKIGDEILYNLTRINSDLTQARVSLVGISNSLFFTNYLDPRVKSSLGEEEISFAPYNALQLQDILRERAAEAFRPGAIEPGVIEKCSAYAAHDHGDARRALELLRVAGELAERSGSLVVSIAHIDEAEDKIERDRVIDVVKMQPKQFQAVLYSILSVCASKKREIICTGEVYDIYKTVCMKTGLRPLTQRRVSDVIAEFDLLGIINTKVISKGRYGRTREISLIVPPGLSGKIKNLLESGLDLQ